jgi:hypothetical protein
MEFVILIILLILFFMWLGWRLRLWWKNFLFSRIRRRGRRGEEVAIQILEQKGYTILQSQISLPGYIYVNDEKQEFDIRPDYLVDKNGTQYLAEVKTGNAASSANRGTRRQLLEYAALGNTDTIILVDATRGTLQKIRFEQMYYGTPHKSNP